MKKRFFGLTAGLCILLSLLTLTVFAGREDTLDAFTNCICATVCSEDSWNTDCPVCAGAEYCDWCASGEASQESSALLHVQALIDALPNADTITNENRADAESQLTAIDDAKFPLTDEELDALDFGRYQAAIAALNVLDDLDGAQTPTVLSSDTELLQYQLNTSDTVTLTKNFTIEETLNISSTVTLDLNGYTLQKLSGRGGCMIIVEDGVHLTITDSSSGQTGTVTNPNPNTVSYSAGCIQVKPGGICTLDGGTISSSNNSAQHAAGGVYVVTRGKFEMTGGAISTCATTASYSAGALYAAQGGQIIIQGGTISGCTTTASNSAAGIYVTDCDTDNDLLMTDGAISNCSTTAANSAGAVYVGSKGRFCMSGGTIFGCSTTASNTAGAVYIASLGKFSMTDGTIRTCTATASGSAGGVYNVGTFTMSGGEFLSCEVTADGDSYANSANNYSAAAAVYNHGSFTMSRGSISSCLFKVDGENAMAGTPHTCCSAGVANAADAAFTMTWSSSLNASSCQITNCLFYPTTASNASNYMFELGVSNAGTMTANGGHVYGIQNYGLLQTTGTYATSFLRNFTSENVFVSRYDQNLTDATISGGVFDGPVHNSGTITDGRFNGQLDCTSTACISGGEFSDTVNNAGKITGGTFTSASSVTNATAAVIQNGTFHGRVTNSSRAARIEGGTFTETSTVQNNDTQAVIAGGTFQGKVSNHFVGRTSTDYYGIVSGGDFAQVTERTSVCKITFEPAGGSLAADFPATQWRYNATVTQPGDPTRTGYRFLGWEHQGAAFDFTQSVTGDADITLTATWQELPRASVTALTKNDRTYDGTAQPLVTGGTASGGIIMYRLAGGSWSASVPTATDAGTYTVFYYAKGDGINYTDSTTDSVTVTIAPKALTQDLIHVVSPTYIGSMQRPTVTVYGIGQAALTLDTDYTITAAETTTPPGATSAIRVGNYNLVITGMGNYSGVVPVTWSITPRAITPTLTLAETAVTYTGAAQTPAVTVKNGNSILHASEYTVQYSDHISAGTAVVTVQAAGNYSFTDLTREFTINRRAVTLTSADASEAYTGAALTKHSVTVTAGSMADGEQFSCNFTGSQTDVGFSENCFTVQNDTAKLANYDITCQFGTLTVTVPTTVDDAVKDLTVDTVTVNDRQAVQQTLNSVNAYLNMQPNQAETMRLEALRDDLLALLAQISKLQTRTRSKAASAPQAATEMFFSDVAERDWFYEDVAYVYANGLMNGVSNGTFAPHLATTRGMIVTILYRLAGSPAVSGDCPFVDVESGTYCEKAIIWAVENRIVNGYGNGKFSPNDPVTREQLAVILYRYALCKALDVSVGADTSILSYNGALEISGYAASAMQWVCGSGIMQGSNGNLLPKNYASRAQVATILSRFCKNTSA